MTHMHADDRIKEIVHEFRHSEGAGMDDWKRDLAPGFEDKPRPWRIEGPMFAAAVLMASATILCLAVIGLLALIFPGAFA